MRPASRASYYQAGSSYLATYPFLFPRTSTAATFTFHNCVIKTKTKLSWELNLKYLLATLRDFISNSVIEMITQLRFILAKKK